MRILSFDNPRLASISDPARSIHVRTFWHAARSLDSRARPAAARLPPCSNCASFSQCSSRARATTTAVAGAARTAETLALAAAARRYGAAGSCVATARRPTQRTHRGHAPTRRCRCCSRWVTFWKQRSIDTLDWQRRETQRHRDTDTDTETVRDSELVVPAARCNGVAVAGRDEVKVSFSTDGEILKIVV